MQPRFDFESEIIVPDASHFLVEERKREREPAGIPVISIQEAL